MNSDPGNPLFLKLFAAQLALAVVWLFLVHWLSRRLSSRHRALHEEFGSFGLFENNTPRTNWYLLEFLFSSRHAETGDRALGNVCYILRVLFVAILGLFLLVLVPILSDIL